MTRKQFRDYADRLYANDILTPLERRRKALKMSEEKKDTTPLTPEKIAEVQKLVEEGTTIADTAAQTGVSVSSVCRIKKGKLTAKRTTEKQDKPAPEQVFATLESTSGTLPPRDVAILRSLIEQVLRVLAGVEGETDADSQNLGQAYGLLTAVQLILGGGAE